MTKTILTKERRLKRYRNRVKKGKQNRILQNKFLKNYKKFN